MSRSQDIIVLLKGLKIVTEALAKNQEAYLKHLWANSTFKDIFEQNLKCAEQQLSKKVGAYPKDEVNQVGNLVKETFERTYVVLEGVRQLATNVDVVTNINKVTETLQKVGKAAAFPTLVETATTSQKPAPESLKSSTSIADIDISSITLKEFESILSNDSKNKKIKLSFNDKVQEKVVSSPPQAPKPAASETTVPKPTVSKSLKEDENTIKAMMDIVASFQPKNPVEIINQVSPIPLPELSVVAKQRKVPSSRVARMASFGGLFAGLGLGTVTELTKGALGLGGAQNVKEAFLSPANTERIVDTLCKVRGAALKLGQILSIQDSNVVSPQLIKAFDRVRQAADYMPDWQVKRVLVAELGSDWRTKMKSFDDKPFAAASIGQVHRGILFDGREVAIKIQYPGVARSIESDIDNLVGMLKVWDVFPAGIFIDNVVTVAKRELAWEVDYLREADYTEKYAEMVAKFPEYRVPNVIRELSTSNILSTELVPGVPMDKCFNLSQEHRHHIADAVMKLCLRELFVFRCMQTDPNWSNFLYDEKTKTLMLIDFGATRFYSKEFMDNYLKVIIAATKGDRNEVLLLSRQMGFLTGYETKAMEKAHVDAVFILGEVFSVEGVFDFGAQSTTKKIAALVPTMVAHRLCPPPEEIYSLHRKLSGLFLLCSRLKAKIACKPMFEEIAANYKFG